MILKLFIEILIVECGSITLIGKIMSIIYRLLFRNLIEFINNDILNHPIIAATFVN